MVAFVYLHSCADISRAAGRGCHLRRIGVPLCINQICIRLLQLYSIDQGITPDPMMAGVILTLRYFFINTAEMSACIEISG